MVSFGNIDRSLNFFLCSARHELKIERHVVTNDYSMSCVVLVFKLGITTPKREIPVRLGLGIADSFFGIQSMII